MPREAGGWLTADALRTAGISEQYAVEKGDTLHEVSLSHDPRQGGYVVQHVVLNLGSSVREVHAWQVGDDLRLGRRQFRTIVNDLGGRA